MTSFLAGLTTADFAEGIARLYPRGRALPRDPDTTLAQLNAALGDAVFGVHAEAVLLLEQEADPSYTLDLLPDWETEYGLPDPCTPAAATLQQRRNALLTKIGAIGGQSEAYFIGVAATLGFTITITTFTPFRAGASCAGDPVWGQLAQFYWRVNAPDITATYFRAGISAAGEPLWSLDNTELECRLRVLAPAHTVLFFQYS